MARGVHLFDLLILIAASVRHQDDGPATPPRMSPARMSPARMARVASLKEWVRTGKSVQVRAFPRFVPHGLSQSTELPRALGTGLPSGSGRSRMWDPARADPDRGWPPPNGPERLSCPDQDARPAGRLRRLTRTVPHRMCLSSGNRYPGRIRLSRHNAKLAE
jgi:hypothetical protein